MKKYEKIALGTVQFGLDYGISNKKGKTDPKEVSKILEFCKQTGIFTLDTAYAYGNSQKILGKNDLSSFDLITKFLPKSEEIPYLKVQVEDSLTQLNINSIYGLLAHRPIELLNNSEDWEYLNFLKAQGIIKKKGFSLNNVEELEILIDNNFIPDLIQIPYNFLDRRFEKLVKKLKITYDIEIHTRSTFLQGLFFMDIRKLPSFFDPLKEIVQIIQSLDLPTETFLLNHVISRSFIDKVVIGVNNLNQLRLNLNHIGEIKELNLNYNLAEIPEDILSPSKWPKLS